MDAAASESLLLHSYRRPRCRACAASLECGPLCSRGRSYGAASRHDAADDRTNEFVSFGTSAPEILVSLAAAREGTPLLAVGNALGSNITNIGLVLGVTALLVPLPVPRVILRREGPWFLASAALVIALFWDNQMTLLDSPGLLAVLAAFAFSLLRRWEDLEVREEESVPHYGRSRAIAWLLLGLALLLISADVLVWSASTLARAGVSELVIGLTVVSPSAPASQSSPQRRARP